MTRTDRILLTAMLAAIALRMAIVNPLPGWWGVVIAFVFGVAAVMFALRKDGANG